jgi:uncharacterized protein YjbJ (UPF0337 family)
MNTLAIKGHWNVAKGKLKQELAHWADDELQFTEGKEEELLGRIQKRKAQEIAGTVPDMESCPTCHHKTT